MNIQTRTLTVKGLVACLVLTGLFSLPVQADPYSGLWVGQVNLSHVNEVPIPLDENNVPIAPDPDVPTLAGDQANIRVILHVNGSGQAGLLRDVAILNRTPSALGDGLPGLPGTFDEGDESDLALITREDLYAEYPAQAGTRIASVVFDFGDSRATEAIDAIVDAVVTQAADHVIAQPSSSFANTASRAVVITNAYATAFSAASDVISDADVESAMFSFRTTYWTPAIVDIVAGDIQSTNVAAAKAAALQLQQGNFYADTRPYDMVVAVTTAVAAVTNAGEELIVARNVTATYLDLTNQYQRFIAGKVFGDMISSVATSAAAGVVASNSEAQIWSDINLLPEVNAAKVLGIQVKVPAYGDTRPDIAVDLVLSQMVASAVASTGLVQSIIEMDLEYAGRGALANSVPKYEIPGTMPTPDYNNFVDSSIYTDAGTKAALAAAIAAVEERNNNVLYTQASVEGAARIAAINALSLAYSTAARAARPYLPMEGSFAVGSGDTRFISAIADGDPALGDAGLSGSIYLPASHPTNPFRHRRHPDHTVGFRIDRNLRFDFDSTSPDPGRPGFGTDWISGTYREEVFGLHKELGQPGDPPIGLKTEGRFRLQRISRIETLNAF